VSHSPWQRYGPSEIQLLSSVVVFAWTSVLENLFNSSDRLFDGDSGPASMHSKVKIVPMRKI